MRINSAIRLAAAVVIASVGLGCSGGEKETDRSAIPAAVDSAVLEQYARLNREGYAAMEQANFDSAKALFAKQAALVPTGRWGHYNLACASARAGDTDAAFAYLDTTVANGWTEAKRLTEDTDLQSLSADPRFTQLLERIRALDSEKQLLLAAGLPRYDAPTRQFSDTVALSAWVEQELKVLRANGLVRQPWQTTLARMDIEAQRLVAMKALLGNGYDLNLERIRATAGLNSPYDESWGPICATIIKEVDAYLAAKPNAEAASEACYHGLTASIMTHGPANSGTPEGQAAYTKAEGYFGQMDPMSKFYGAGEAWLLAARLAAAGDNRPDLYPQVKDFAAKYAADQSAMRTSRILLAADLVRANWPLPLDATDIDGKAVSLANYKGKVVLLDFWATWCGPCRAELPFLKAAYEKYQNEGFEILSISLDYPDRTDQAAYRAWIDQNGMPWRHVYDEKNWDSPLALSFAVSSIPSPFLIGKDGSLIALHDDCRGANLEPLIQKALAMQL